MGITLIGHQPIDFTYKENEPCENLSDMCLQYETGDNPMFQIKVTSTSAPLVTIQGTNLNEIAIPAEMISVSGDYWTFSLNFEDLGIETGCYELCVYDIGVTGSNLITNGNFTSNLNGWTVADALEITIDSYTDDSVTVSASGGIGPYTYSKDGTNYQGSATFTGLTTGPYTFYAKDSNNAVVSISFTLYDCSTFTGSEAYDLVPVEAFAIKDCEAASFV